MTNENYIEPLIHWFIEMFWIIGKEKRKEYLHPLRSYTYNHVLLSNTLSQKGEKIINAFHPPIDYIERRCLIYFL